MTYANEQTPPADEGRLEAPVRPGPPDARWYCVSRDGLATLCLNEANALEMADHCSTVYPRGAPYRAMQLGDIAAERERCAQVCEAEAEKWESDGVPEPMSRLCAHAIRA